MTMANAPENVRPGDLISSDFINQILARLEALEGEGPPGDQAAILTVVPGNIVQGIDSGSPISGSLAKIAELRAMRPGSYRVGTFLTNPPAGYAGPQSSGIASRVFVNDVASPQSAEHSLTTVANHLFVATEVITVQAGDRIQLYARKVLPNNPSTGVIGEIQISIANPLAPAVIPTP
jgi:hypothetical protein